MGGSLGIGSNSIRAEFDGCFQPDSCHSVGWDRLTAIDPFQPVMRVLLERKIMPRIQYLRSVSRLSVVVLMLTSAAVSGADSMSRIRATGTFRPDGPPQQQPVRVDAGSGCVVDVRQAYIVEGTLEGSFNVDFRILVRGPCGSPLGTFAEEWIARGEFVGSLEGESTTARFTYTATVKPGGEVSGLIVLGQGLAGKLRVRGSFSDGELIYDGRLDALEQE